MRLGVTSTELGQLSGLVGVLRDWSAEHARRRRLPFGVCSRRSLKWIVEKLCSRFDPIPCTSHFSTLSSETAESM